MKVRFLFSTNSPSLISEMDTIKQEISERLDLLRDHTALDLELPFSECLVCVVSDPTQAQNNYYCPFVNPRKENTALPGQPDYPSAQGWKLQQLSLMLSPSISDSKTRFRHAISFQHHGNHTTLNLNQNNLEIDPLFFSLYVHSLYCLEAIKILTDFL